MISTGNLFLCKVSVSTIGIILIFCGIAISSVKLPQDSVSKPVLMFTPRINSTGHFPFTGSLINHHLNADLNIFYNRKLFGFFIFKSQDLQDSHSIVNYLQPGIFSTLTLSPVLRVRGFFGYLFSQTNHFRDPDSDYYGAVTFYWDIKPNLHLENTMLYYDVSTQAKLTERLLISWQAKAFKIDFYTWHRIVLEKSNHATSASLALTFPQLKISEKVSLWFTSSYYSYVSANKPDYALRNGFLFSLAMPITATP